MAKKIKVKKYFKQQIKSLKRWTFVKGYKISTINSGDPAMRIIVLKDGRRMDKEDSILNK